MEDRFTKKIEERVFKNILSKKLLNKNDTLIVSISGGPDSTFLLHILDLFNKKYNFNLKIYMAHLNHNLREEAKRDEDFVRELSKKYNKKLFVKSVDVEKVSKENKESIELTGRHVRQKFLEEIKDEIVKIENKKNVEEKLDKTKIKIVLGHHRDDVVETFFLNISRGSSINGMGSIKEVNKGKVRPIIFLSKDEILKYLEKRQIPYVIDKTNFETEYARNKIRNEIIPYLNKNINSGASKNIFNLIKDIWSLNDFLEKEAEKVVLDYLKEKIENKEKEEIIEFVLDKKIELKKNLKKGKTNIKYFKIEDIKNINENILKRVIYKIIKYIDVNSGIIEDIYNLIIRNVGNKYIHILNKQEKIEKEKKEKAKNIIFLNKNKKIYILDF